MLCWCCVVLLHQVQNYAFVIAVVALTWKDDCVTQRQALVFPYTATCAYVINSVLIVAG